MKKVDKNKFYEIELLEEELLQKFETYKGYKNSEKNKWYFNNIHYRAMRKLDEKSSKAIFPVPPTISYAILFIISFAISFQLIDFNEDVSLNDESFLFSDTSPWQEEEAFLSSISDEELNLDYTNYFYNEINYTGNSFLNEELLQLSESEFDEIYENLKYKKIL
ncbi:MAG: hypothetical protein L3J41_17770 [Melioribacteraceae bacterium]|nr:hypothetical protein [Melioribacteraceae bacterium]